MNNDISTEDYLKGIAKARKDLTSLIDKIRKEKYKGSDELWVGADVAIDTKAPPRSTAWWPPQDDYVVTPYCKELSWLFRQLRDIFYECQLIDASNKEEFFGWLADAAIAYMETTDDGVGNCEALLLATHLEAEVILKKMLCQLPHGE
ncbi:hypothetical protein H8D83_01405 [Candidatus Woesearchaeota archaeon]|nr:hypothetical protein [Candidatus Woesearchaeota archaeon]